MEGIAKLSIAVGVAFAIGLGVMWVTDRMWATPVVVQAPSPPMAARVAPQSTTEEFKSERNMSPADMAEMQRLLGKRAENLRRDCEAQGGYYSLERCFNTQVEADCSKQRGKIYLKGLGCMQSP